MASHYKQSIGRLKVEYHPQFGAGSQVEISCIDGWNDDCHVLTHRLSLEELSDLQYLISRVFAATPVQPKGE